jgi:ABC-2 type transport system ATP-binding protein
MEVFEGELFGLVGPDGAGKTTLVRTLCGILKNDSGSFSVFGLDGKKDRDKIKQRIGYLSQKFSLYGDLTIDENIKFFAKIHNIKDFRDKKKILLERMGIEKFSGRLAERLSGGMKQKLALACTLIHSPEILILDEPTTGVDPVSRREFWQILAGLKKEGITIFVTTPYLDEAERCDRVAFMYDGSILECNYPGAVKDSFDKTVVEIVCSSMHEVFKFLTGINKIENIQSFGDRIHVVIDEKQIGAEILKNKILEKDFQILDFRTINPSLEDIFLIKLKETAGEKDNEV